LQDPSKIQNRLDRLLYDDRLDGFIARLTISLKPGNGVIGILTKPFHPPIFSS
jgi:hypothetical protein